MSRPRLGAAPMSSAERQARRRARLRQKRSASPAAPTRRLAPRPARWAAATATLARLQQEYRDWLTNLPPNLQSSALADKLQTIVRTRPRGVAGGRPATRLWSRLISRLTTKAPYKPAPAQAGEPPRRRSLRNGGTRSRCGSPLWTPSTTRSPGGPDDAVTIDYCRRFRTDHPGAMIDLQSLTHATSKRSSQYRVRSQPRPLEAQYICAWRPCKS